MSYKTYTVTIDDNDTSRDATGSGVFVLLEAESRCYFEQVVFQPLGDNSATAARVFINNGEAVREGKNNKLAGEVTLAATSSTGETAAVASTALSLGKVYLEEGQRLLVAIGVSPTDGFDAWVTTAANHSDFNV